MTETTHPCDYAYPVAPGDVPYWQPGMTLRDYFAGQAIIGLATLDVDCGPDGLAHDAYRIADAMMKTRRAIK